MGRSLGAVWCALCLIAAGAICDTRNGRKQIQLNPDALVFARQLVTDGHVTADKMGQWRLDKPSVEAENRFIEEYGFTEYAKWHLGIDPGCGEYTKARYRFPFGDFTNVHRCGVIAAQHRARQAGYEEIAGAAAALARAIDEVQPNQPKPSKTRR